MGTLDETIAPPSTRCQAAAQCFAWQLKTVQPSPPNLVDAEGLPTISSKAKGIRKLSLSAYVLVARQAMDGPYPDSEPIHRDHGSWLYFHLSLVAIDAEGRTVLCASRLAPAKYSRFHRQPPRRPQLLPPELNGAAQGALCAWAGP
jgi:hypothetical protein